MDENMCAAIVKSKEPDYAPTYVEVRARISPLIFTCNFPADKLKDLEDDPKIHSVALDQKMYLDE